MDILDKHINDLTREDWIELYYKRGMSLPQLAKHFRVSTKPITERMDQFGIPRRGFGPKPSLNIPKDLLVELYINQKLSAVKIAKKLSCSDKTIRDKIEEYGLKKLRPSEVLTVEFLSEQRELGKTPKEIAQEVGFSVPVIYKFLHLHGFEVNESFAKKRNLRFEDVVVNMYQEGKTTTEIASALESNTTRVLNILNRQGVEIKKSNDYHRKLPDPEYLDKLYREGFSIGQIAEKYSVETYAVLYWLEKLGTPLRDKSETRMGELNPMDGQKHTKAARSKMSKAYVGKVRELPDGPLGNPTPLETPFQGEVMTRSSWEAAVGRYLGSKDVDYEYEPDTFEGVIDGVSISYTPDFKIFPDKNDAASYLYIEVKGHFTDEAKKKVCYFQTQGCNIEVWGAEKLQELGILDNSLRVLL